MRERLLLFFILFGLGVFLYIFQNHVDTTKVFVILCACMVVYGLYSIAATKYQKRKLKKNPIVINGFEWVDISFPEFEDLMKNCSIL